MNISTPNVGYSYIVVERAISYLALAHKMEVRKYLPCTAVLGGGDSLP